ncbi:MAG: CRTAC1 family protein [Fuerstiella sp.]
MKRHHVYPFARHILLPLSLLTLLLPMTGCRNESNKKPVVMDDGTATNNPENNNQANNTPAKAQKSILSVDAFNSAVAARNKAIGHLENKEWQVALEQFGLQQELLPHSITTSKNRAIAEVLVLIDGATPYKASGSPEERQKFQQAVASAFKAIQTFRAIAVEPFDRAFADHLDGLLTVHEDSAASGNSDKAGFEQGLSLLKKAADAMPERADFRFAVAAAMNGNRNYSIGDSDKVAELTEQFQKSFELAPQNLFALQRLLRQQALTLASKNPLVKQKAEQLSITLQKAKPLLAPLNQSIKAQHRLDIQASIDAALASKNQMASMGPAMTIANLLSPEISTMMDGRRLSKNLLEYLELNFNADDLKRFPKAASASNQTETVVTQWKSSNSLPNLTGVTDLQVRDFDLDGIDDILVAREGRFEVYSRATVDASEWSLLTQSAADVSVPIQRFVTADLDRDSDRSISTVPAPVVLQDIDGDRRIPSDFAKQNRWYDTDLDIIGFGDQGLCLLHNKRDENNNRLLEEWPSSFPAKIIHDAVCADFDADGDLDIVLGTDSGLEVFRSLDGTTFEAVTDSVTSPEFPIHRIQAVDWDLNVAIDFAAASDDGRSGYLENMLHGRFRWIDQSDAHNLKNSNFGLQSRPDGSWEYVGQPSSDQLALADLDNDGRQDQLNLSSGNISWYRGLFDGSFETTEAQPAFPDHLNVSAMTVSDIDSDGDLDLLLTVGQQQQLQQIENVGGNTNQWIDVVARAVFSDPQFPSNRVNMHGIGSIAEVWSADTRQRQMITQPRTHFGLGSSQAADLVRIIWTDGIPQNVTSADALKARIGIQAPQILKGSCPYIYTWTGERFEFFSDCLWAAPLGLVGADGTIAPTREWENLLIPGQALVEKEGHYFLQLTEELWEIAYFDQVELSAIDHPADVQIFTNEKVGPPSLANHKIHSAKNPRLPVSVVNAKGRNLLPGLTHLDKDYVQAFERRKLQGLTNEWTMEFDLGKLAQNQSTTSATDSDNPSSPSIKLFLMGWVFPTDTSLNLAIHQNPNLQPPMPPVIEVPNQDGTWKTVRPFIGFPSGKTKAMVVELSDVFPKDTVDFRFRLRSTMELYFDQAFFTLNEGEHESVVQQCELIEADLHERGFSRRTYSPEALFRQGHAPEGYDYDAVTTESRWPTIHGRFTRFGQVTQLLNAHDDQMIVMGPGDEVTVKFAVPLTPVPRGWKRDFVLRNVGFDKDADLNTIYGQTSEPFPFRKMNRYPFGTEDAPNSPEYLEYLEQWQTRKQNPFRFRNAGSAARR